MFSDNAKKQIDACRFCWMCRHVCPVGLATGKEATTPRGRAVLLKYILTGMNIEEEVAPDMFACCLCNACASWCETGFEPAVYIREARTEALVGDYVPAAVAPVVDRVLETGSIYAASNPVTGAFPEKADVLLVLGETARAKRPDIVAAAISLLKKAGVNFTVLADEPPVGAMMFDLVGEINEVKSVAESFAEKAKATGAETIVLLDPADTRMIKQEYARWGISFGAVETITTYVAGLLEKGTLKVAKPYTGTVTFHDPCKLARDLEETEPARAILAATGATLKEMYLNRENTRCCGGEVLASHSESTTKLISQNRLDDAKRTKADFCITACPGCADMLGKDGGDFIKDIFVLLDSCC